MSFDTDDEVRESIAFAKMVARMIPYAEDYSDDDADPVNTINNLIHMARGIFADKPQDDDAEDDA